MFGIGIGELLVLLIVIGLLVGLVYSARRLAGGHRDRELEAAKRDFERTIEAKNRK